MRIEEYHIAISVEMFSSRNSHNNIVYWAESIREGVNDFSPDVVDFCGHVADYMLTQDPFEVEMMRGLYQDCPKDQYDMERVLRLADEKMSGTSFVFSGLLTKT